VYQACVERALLPAAFDVDFASDLKGSKIKIKSKLKSSGQECPLHTSLIREASFTQAQSLLWPA
jgi:hypothetical protein